ncbi:Relaxase/Mobilization nuclease domain protein [compost metagenome]
MKGMQAISRGSGFGGMTKYGVVNANGDLEGEIIGGNMSGTTAQELSKEFGLSRKLRPDVKKPVWHNSLRLPKGDKLEKDKWVKMANDYMKRMGFSEAHQRVYILHDDEKGQHIHIIASRISLENKLYLGKNENLKSTRHIQKLERDYGLTQTTGPDKVRGNLVMPDTKRPTAGEAGKFKRTGETPERIALAKLIDTAMTDKPSASAFAERLALAGVEVRANFNKGTLNGFSFSLNGVPFKGSQLGKQYTGQGLAERGLTYVPDRDYAQLQALTAASRGNQQRDPAATDLGKAEPDSRNPAGHSRDQKAPGDQRRIDRQGSRELDRGPAGDSAAGSGRREQPGNVDRAERTTPEGFDPGVERRDVRAEVDPGAKTAAERPSDPSAAVAPAREHGHQHGDIGDGITSGVEVSSAGVILTGDKGSDELIKAAHSGRMKAEREALSRQKKQHAADMASAQKRQAELDKPASNRLSWLSDRSTDPTWRGMEIQAFAKATGAGKFEITCSSPNPGEKPVKKVFTAEQLQNPATIRSMAHMSARRFDVSIRPDPASGVILLKGLDADHIKKLEAIGLQPAAVVDISGKKEAWIATGAKLSVDERTALTQRLETLTGVKQKHGGAGGLAGFSSGQRAVSLSACPGQIAPTVRELIGEIRAEAFEAKALARQEIAAKRLEQAIEKEVHVKSVDYADHGGIKTLRKGWLSDKYHATLNTATTLGDTYTPATVERGVIAAMARQGVTAGQAYRSVFDESRVCAGRDLDAAHLVTETYTRVALEHEGRSSEGVDLQAEARTRFPDVLKQAEKGTLSELKGEAAEQALERQQDQKRLDAEAHKRLEQAQEEAKKRRALEQEDVIKPK